MKLKSVLRPNGCNIRCFNMSLASKGCLFKVLWKPKRIAGTSMSLVEWPGDVRWHETRWSVLAILVERRCSGNVSLTSTALANV